MATLTRNGLKYSFLYNLGLLDSIFIPFGLNPLNISTNTSLKSRRKTKDVLPFLWGAKRDFTKVFSY